MERSLEKVSPGAARLQSGVLETIYTATDGGVDEARSARSKEAVSMGKKKKSAVKKGSFPVTGEKHKRQIS